MATALIIGANRGIGLELARQLSARGDEVIATCRRPSPELEGLGVRIEAGVDVAKGDSIAALDGRLGELELDLLLNNAGIMERTSLEGLDFDSVRRQFEINSMGPLRVVERLRHRLKPGSKIAMVTSRMGSLNDNGSGSGYGYRMSKAAANMAGISLAHDLREAGVAVAMLHPGWVRTDLTGDRGEVDADEAAAGLIARIDELDLEHSGGFWHQNGARLAW